MKIFAISDLHLAISSNKPMDIFGGVWDNYLEKIKQDWLEKVSDEDVVIVAGDISWAMKLEQFAQDLAFFNSLPGQILFVRGNHDYWWGTISKVRAILPPNINILQNNAIKIGNHIFCGTRGWEVPHAGSTEQDLKIFEREKIRMTLALQDALKLQDNNQKIVAIMHYPPFTAKNKNTDFTKMFAQYGVSAVVFGHVHKDFMGLKLVETIDNIDYYLTSCDLLNNKLTQIVTTK